VKDIPSADQHLEGEGSQLCIVAGTAFEKGKFCCPEVTERFRRQFAQAFAETMNARALRDAGECYVWAKGMLFRRDPQLPQCGIR